MHRHAARAHVLVPLKRLNGAKSRLAAAISPDERERVMLEMLLQVLAAARAARVGPVTIVSSEPLTVSHSIERFDDRGLEWNEALAAAMREVVREECAAVVSGDLPRLTPDDVRALVSATPARGVAIARAKDGGTNAVAMRPPAVMPTRFGERASAALHEREARAAGLDAVVLDTPGLAFDVDTPEDLAAWR